MTLSQAWESYLQVAAVDPVTLRSYASSFRRHLEPAMGHRPVVDLTQDAAVRLLDGLQTGGAGPVLAPRSPVLDGLLGGADIPPG